jgi:hypothetical protein
MAEPKPIAKPDLNAKPDLCPKRLVCNEKGRRCPHAETREMTTPPFASYGTWWARQPAPHPTRKPGRTLFEAPSRSFLPTW